MSQMARGATLIFEKFLINRECAARVKSDYWQGKLEA